MINRELWEYFDGYNCFWDWDEIEFKGEIYTFCIFKVFVWIWIRTMKYS